ncbi:MAG: diaminopimelate epimerase [Rickettsiales bacterium]|nr:diaminopimelate epimerase [Rickettsiales bacterium]
MVKRHCIRMDGTGNDFLIFDARTMPLALTPAQVRALARRDSENGGADQIIVMESSASADVRMRIYNADGGEVESCGNASRCVGWLMTEESGKEDCRIETLGGMILATRTGLRDMAVDMGQARTEWQEIPLAEARDTLHLPVVSGPLEDGVGVSMGNPHAVFFVPDVASIALEQHGPVIQQQALFPQGVNVGVAQIENESRIRLRVYERGAGETRACGTGACAALVAAVRRGLTDRKAEVVLLGGVLHIQWQPNGHVIMRGAVSEPHYLTVEM